MRLRFAGHLSRSEAQRAFKYLMHVRRTQPRLRFAKSRRWDVLYTSRDKPIVWSMYATALRASGESRSLTCIEARRERLRCSKSIQDSEVTRGGNKRRRMVDTVECLGAREPEELGWRAYRPAAAKACMKAMWLRASVAGKLTT